MDEKGEEVMREILFRGKRVDNGEWVEGNLFVPDKADTPTQICIGTNIIRITYDIIPETIGQYTGLTDKNGKKIFEGDVCRFREWSQGDMCWIGKVHYEYQQFVISGDKNEECESPFTLVMSRFISENIEVIGNIHDNPELLKGR